MFSKITINITCNQKLAENLSENQAIVFAAFSQNYALKEKDEIQSAHYTKRHVTLHTCTMYVIRHSKSTCYLPCMHTHCSFFLF